MLDIKLGPTQRAGRIFDEKLRAARHRLRLARRRCHDVIGLVKVRNDRVQRHGGAGVNRPLYRNAECRCRHYTPGCMIAMSGRLPITSATLPMVEIVPTVPPVSQIEVGAAAETNNPPPYTTPAVPAETDVLDGVRLICAGRGKNVRKLKSGLLVIVPVGG